MIGYSDLIEIHLLLADEDYVEQFLFDATPKNNSKVKNFHRPHRFDLEKYL